MQGHLSSLQLRFIADDESAFFVLERAATWSCVVCLSCLMAVSCVTHCVPMFLTRVQEVLGVSVPQLEKFWPSALLEHKVQRQQ